tara:strand:- start:310 stop:1371 length:1062 start_codon:yes stop_codon:yes gene_type:complete
MAKFVNITANDTILTTTKVTKGLFTGDVGTITGASLSTSSLSTTQKAYYYTLQMSGEDQFSVTYGHRAGSGSGDEGTNTFGKTRAIYKQFASMLLPFNEVETGFVINSVSQSDCYFIQFERARMKDRVNRKNWTLHLSGSAGSAAGGTGAANFTGSILKLTDDSNISASGHSPVGPVYNIVSGSSGKVANNTPYGLFYPNVGVLVLSPTRLSSSLPGSPAYINSGSKIHPTHQMHVGLGSDPRVDGNADNPGKLVNSILLSNQLTYRSEEDQTSATYFCRARAPEFNFSNNPTFSSGSRNEFSIPSFEGNPQVFITTVGLYNSQDSLMAVGRLSSPVEKNYSSEATIKVKLTY